ncbi:MAG TPA: thiamine pyrophosphate-binding protein [Chloroflexota bacterium]|nr:thiamine pyrophosphate-binding protein [Chloroflexota bacterium]
MATLTGAELLVRALRAEGVETVFTLIGDHILPIADAAVDHGLRFIDTRHESAAMHMAEGWAQATGRVGVCLVTGGPGHANVLPGLTVAWTSESPVVQISGRPELQHEGMLAHQELDQIAMAAPISKAAWLVRRPADIPLVVARAFRLARAGRPGPIHLTIPLDVQEARVEPEALPPLPAARLAHAPAAPAPGLVEQAVALLRAAARPVAIVGTAARYAVAPGALAALAEALRLPVFTVEQARGLLSDEHELCFGYADPALNAAARALREADAVLLVGKRLDARIGYGRPPFLAADARVVQVEAEPAEIGRNRGVDVAIESDLGAAVEALAAAARRVGAPTTPSEWLARLQALRAEHLAHLRTVAEDDAVPLHPMRVARAVEPLVDADTHVVLDGGDFVQWPRAYLPARRVGRWHRLGPLGHLGIGLPLALGIQAAEPEARVLLFIGDGSVGFYFMEWDTAVRHCLPIVAVLGNDATWGIDNYFQLAYYGRAVATTLRSVRYDRLVAELGGYGEHVEQASELAGALERAFASRRPALIDVAVRRVPSPLGEAMAARRLAVRQGASD